MTRGRLAITLLVGYVGSLGAAPDELSAVLFVAIGFFGLSGFIRYKAAYRPQTRKAALWLVAIALATAVSSVVTYANGLDFERSFGLALRIALTLVMFFAGYYVGYFASAKTAYLGVVCVAFVHITTALMGVVAGTAPVIDGVVRPAGFLSPNIIANSAMIGAICSLALFVYARRGSRFAIWTGFCFCLLCGFLVYAATLKNVLTLGFGSLVVFLLYHRKIRFSRVMGFLFWSLLAAVVVFVATPTGERLINTVSSALGHGGSEGGLSSLEWRVAHWELLLLDWWNNYRFTGSGVGQAINMAGIRAQYDQEGPIAHNDYVALLVEFGPILGVVVLVSWVAVVRGLFSAFAGAPLLRVTTVGVSSCIFLAMAGGNVMYTVAYLYLFWIIFGGSYGELDAQRRRRRVAAASASASCVGCVG